MTITEIFAQFRKGSQGFVQAVQDYCGYDCSHEEIARIAERANNADEFQTIWENEDWWADANN
jgi:hypothetical protein